MATRQQDLIIDMKKYSKLFRGGSRDDAQAIESQVYEHQYAVQSAHDLLQPKYRVLFMQRIEQQSRAPEKYFKALYQKLIETLADYTQSLPDSDPRYEPLIGNLFDNALSRALTAITMRHHMTLPKFGTQREISEQYALWTYVVFSSALLWNIGKLAEDYEICQTATDGRHGPHWSPYDGSMNEQSIPRYKVRTFQRRHLGAVDGAITHLLARQLMPEDGFNWITTNPQAFRDWLHALVPGRESTTSVTYLIKLSDELCVSSLDPSINLEELEARIQQLTESDIKLKDLLLNKISEADRLLLLRSQLEHEETMAGEAFLQWLKKNIAEKKISINNKDSLVHMTNEGALLLFPAIFQNFCKTYPRFSNWVVVFKQFNALGLTKLSGGDYVFEKWFSENPSHKTLHSSYGAGTEKNAHAVKRKGIIVSEVKAIFGNDPVPAASPHIRSELKAEAAAYPAIPEQRKSRHGLRPTEPGKPNR